MRKCVQRGLFGALCAGGIIVLGTGAASAAQSSGDEGLVSGNQVLSHVTAPISADGNSVSVIGDNKVSSVVDRHLPGHGASTGKQAKNSDKGSAATTTGRESIAGGNEVDPKVSAPVSVSGNTVSVVGDNESRNTVKRHSSDPGTPAQKAVEASGSKGASASTSGRESVAGGNQVDPKVSAPVSASGNTVSVIGDNTSGNTVTEAEGGTGAPHKKSAPMTSGEDSAVGGNQAAATVKAPISANGNTLSVVGDNHAKNSGSTPTRTHTVTASEPRTPEAVSSGRDSLLGGNQVVPWFFVPVSADGNTLSVIGDNRTENVAAHPSSDDTGKTAAQPATTSGEDAVAGGNQLLPAVTAPVNLTGNTVSVIGDNAVGHAGSEGMARPGTTSSGGTSTPTTSGDDGVAGGNQVAPRATAPVDVTGNSLALIGDNTAVAPAAAGRMGSTTPKSGNSTPVTSGDEGVAGGNQVLPVVTVPVNVGGNGVAVIGDNMMTAPAGDGTNTSGTTPGNQGTKPVTTGDDGIAGGNQVLPVVTVPVNVGGNGVTVIGDNMVSGPAVGGEPVSGTAPEAGATNPATSGDEGVAGGNQILPVVNVPVNVGGNSVAVIGDNLITGPAGDGTNTSGTTPGNQGTNPVTSGDDGVSGGNQIIPGVTLPVTIGGNAVSVIGDNTVTVPGDTGSTDPGTTPVNPGTNPENPGTTPENPGTNPVEPGTPVTPGEPTTPGDPANPTQPTNPATPGTPVEPGEGTTPIVPVVHQVPLGSDVAATNLGGSAATGGMMAAGRVRSMTGTWVGTAGPAGPDAGTLAAAPSLNMLAQTGANAGSLVWFGGLLVLFGAAIMGLRRFLGAK